MNPVVEAQLKEFSEANKTESLSTAEFFEVFSIHSIENGILGQNIDPFSAHLEASEFGIDGISVLIQGDLCTDPDEAAAALSIGKNHNIEFHFFQSKTSESLDYGSLSKFLDAVIDFFEDGELAKSPQISDLRSVKDLVYSSAAKRTQAFAASIAQQAPARQARLSISLLKPTISA